MTVEAILGSVAAYIVVKVGNNVIVVVVVLVVLGVHF
jgi:hypothetical protein